MSLVLSMKRFVRRYTFNRRISLWKLVVLIFICLSCSAAILWYCNEVWTPESEYIRDEELGEDRFYAMLNSLPRPSGEVGRRDGQKCQSPNLPVYTKYIRENRPASIPTNICSKSGGENWLRVAQSRVHFKPEYSGASCTAEPIVRLDDQSSYFDSARPLRHGDELPSLGFRASCTVPDGRSHSSVYYGVRRAPSPGSGKSATEAGSSRLDNIIMLGLDSLSRLESARSLHRASHLMQTRLGGVTLKQYNILGDGTPAALLPILTGTREADMPEARKGFAGARFVDESMRWIFQDLRDRGFLTLYGEEQNAFGTFQLRFHGFKKEPADFYLRPALLQQEKLQTNTMCIGDEFASTRMLSAVKDLFTLHPSMPKFAFAFFSYLSHENSDLSPMDTELSKFLEWFEAENLSQNTTIILMSDHGQRQGPLRNSMQGKLEESLPLMSIALSKQLMSHKKDAAEMLRNNANRLTTPVDIHKTLLSIAGVKDRVTGGSDAKLRSYSLIDEAVPESRSCSEAGIPTHWCSCLRLRKIREPGSNELAVRAARFAVSQMNSATESFRHLCQELRLGSITEADISQASDDLARRERRVNWSYLAYNAENSALLAAGFLTVRLGTEPNGGHFEATLQFGLERRSGGHRLQLSSAGEASRIDRYGRQADCVVQVAPHLRKFCLCRPASAA